MLTGLVFVGACGNAAEAIEAAWLAAEANPGLRPAGVLDDRPDHADQSFHGLPILGTTALARELPGCVFLLCVGSVRTHARRLEIAAGLGLGPERFATLAHPMAWVSPSAVLGRGVFVGAGCAVGAGVRLGDHALLLPGCVIGHDAVIGAGACLASSVALAGSVAVGPEVYLGMGARVREGVSLGARSLVGMGAVVLGDVEPGARVAGCPARPLGGAPGAGHQGD